jgi:hypothetical protein
MRYEASDEVFVAMPFTGVFQQAYDSVIEPAIVAVRLNGKSLKARIINRGTTGSPDIHEQIFDAIIHSRLVIADLTVQSSYPRDGSRVERLTWKLGSIIGMQRPVRWQPNANVAYEVGLASAWRNPEDILLVHQEHEQHAYSFDIQNLRHVSYDPGGRSSVQVLSDEIVRAINQSTFLARQTFQKLIQSLSPSAIQYMHEESRRTFPIIGFPDHGMPIMDARIHAIAELLAVGALKNRTVFSPRGGHGTTVLYQWTDLGLRMMVAIGAITQERRKELADQIGSIPDGEIPPKELTEFPQSEPAPNEPQGGSDSADAAGS